MVWDCITSNGIQKSRVRTSQRTSWSGTILLSKLFSLSLGLGHIKLDLGFTAFLCTGAGVISGQQGGNGAPQHLQPQRFTTQRSWLSYTFPFSLFIEKVCVSQSLVNKTERKMFSLYNDKNCLSDFLVNELNTTNDI